MAVTKEVMQVNLRAIVVTGEDMETGRTIYKNRNFNGVRYNVTPDEAMDVLESIMSLQKHTVYNYQQIDRSDLYGVPEIPA